MNRLSQTLALLACATVATRCGITPITNASTTKDISSQALSLHRSYAIKTGPVNCESAADQRLVKTAVSHTTIDAISSVLPVTIVP